MHWNYGSTFKKIRKSKGLTQKAVIGENLSPATLSKLENDRLTPSLETFQYLLEQIGMDYDEFEYISNAYSLNEKKEIVKEYFQIASNSELPAIYALKAKCEKYLRSRNDRYVEQILSILTSYLALAGGPGAITPLSKSMLNEVWRDLEQLDEWYADDLRMLNGVLYYLPLETVEALYPKLLKNLEKYQDYMNIESLKIALLLNLATLFLENNKLAQCNEASLMAERWAKTAHRYDFVAVCKVRQGICQQDEALFTQGMTILAAIEEDALASEMQKEIDYYLSPVQSPLKEE
ncbi:helix-turn-helix domain-containing protein [Enterococcus asini]|uniref:helix-turn-helix domain-containing protein n=1 Tax=Enterococcus asini TaxID=57732 RepID=UPI00266D1E8C|nr:helix-turn-helix transcriptional regulator [Enterococcus asini]